MSELITFSAFLCIAVTAHVLGKMFKEHERYIFLNKRSHNRIRAAAIGGAVAHLAAHPTICEALRDYVVHFVIYSPYVLHVM